VVRRIEDARKQIAALKDCDKTNDANKNSLERGLYAEEETKRLHSGIKRLNIELGAFEAAKAFLTRRQALWESLLWYVHSPGPRYYSRSLLDTW
jgi:hypothetical protein